MALVGVIGPAVAEEPIVVAGLADIRDKAAAARSEVSFIVAVEKAPSDSIGVVLQWLKDEEIEYMIVAHPDVKSELGELGDAAHKTISSKTPSLKVVEQLIKDGGDALLVLLPDDDDMIDNELRACINKVAGSQIDALNLANGLDEESLQLEEIVFGEDGEDGDVDYAQLGADADNDDEDAQAKLNELAFEVGLDESNYDTWTEFAEAIMDAVDSVAKDAQGAPDDEPSEEPLSRPEVMALGVSGDDDDAEAQEQLTEIGTSYGLDEADYDTWKKYAIAICDKMKEEADAGDDAQRSADKDDNVATMWTAETLKLKDLPDLRSIAAASGMSKDEAKKATRPALEKFLLKGETAPSAPSTTTSGATSKSSVKVDVKVDTTIAGRIDDAFKRINDGLQALVNVLIEARGK